MWYSVRKQVSHDPACHGVMGQHCDGFSMPFSGSWLGVSQGRDGPAFFLPWCSEALLTIWSERPIPGNKPTSSEPAILGMQLQTFTNRAILKTVTSSCELYVQSLFTEFKCNFSSLNGNYGHVISYDII